MSRIVYYKLVVFVFLFTFDAFLYAKLLRPSKDRDQKEILVINSKRRVYYPIKQKGITYQINGPTRIEFISRYPVLRKKKNSHSFNYIIVLNKKDTINPNSKLPLSPKNNFGSLKNEKLKNKKQIIGIIIVIRKNWTLSSFTKKWVLCSKDKKYKIANTEIDVKPSIPSIPSK